MKKNNLVVFSRHPSHAPLRKADIKLPVLTCMRLGSTTKGKLKYGCEINSTESVRVSANKKLMKQAFLKAGVKNSQWWIYDNKLKLFIEQSLTVESQKSAKDLPYPIIAKNIFGSRGTGNYKLDNEQELIDWLGKRKDRIDEYIFEAFFKKGREYRIHVTKMGYFYTCRKMLKKDAEETWHRHDENCVWIKEENPLFDKPVNWDVIVADCVKALEAIGADVLAFDVKVQTAKDKKGNVRQKPDFIIIESASAPSFGEVTLQKYLEIIPQIVKYKLNPEPTVVVAAIPQTERYCDRKVFKDYFIAPTKNTSSQYFEIFNKDGKVVDSFGYKACYRIVFDQFDNDFAKLHQKIQKVNCPYSGEFIKLWVEWMASCELYVEFEEFPEYYDFVIDFKKLDKRYSILTVCVLLRYLSETSYYKIPDAVEKQMRTTDDFISALAKVHTTEIMNNFNSYYSSGHGLMYLMDNHINTKKLFLQKIKNSASMYTQKYGQLNDFFSI
jgi:hypothetical protein